MPVALTVPPHSAHTVAVTVPPHGTVPPACDSAPRTGNEERTAAPILAAYAQQTIVYIMIRYIMYEGHTFLHSCKGKDLPVQVQGGP